MPRALLSRPVVFPSLKPYWEAFWMLSSSRAVGMGIGAIPFSAIVDWFRWMKIADEEQEEFLLYIRILDAEFLAVYAEQAKKR